MLLKSCQILFAIVYKLQENKAMQNVSRRADSLENVGYVGIRRLKEGTMR